MAEETTPQPTESEEFDWGQFFLQTAEGEEPVQQPAPVAEAPVEEPVVGDDEDMIALKKELEELRSTVSKTAATTNEIEHRTRLATAMEAWKTQASPAELSMSDVLAESTSLEDLKARATMIKRVTANTDQMREQIRREEELKMQKEYGYPIPPTFSPVPEQEKVNAMLEAGDIDAAANAILKGVFNS